MRLSAPSRQAIGGDGGFTLLEVVVAAGLLLLTVTAVTFSVVNVSRAGTRLEGSMERDRALRRVAQRLCLLPYCAGFYPQVKGGRGDLASDLVAAVFPHADSAENTASARFLESAGDVDEPAGSFVTMLIEDEVQVTCVARFLAGPDGPELGPEAVRGWDAATAAAPPASALSLTLSVAGEARLVEFSRSALSSAPIDPQPMVGAGG